MFGSNKIVNNTSLFIGDLSKFCSEIDLENLFSRYGNLVDLKIKRNNNTGKTLSYGFVSFDNVESANNAMQQLDGSMFFGRRLRIRQAAYNARSQAQQHDPLINSIYVRFSTSKLNVYVTEEDFHGVFDKFGCVQDVSIKESSIDKRTNRQCGYGFVHFTCDEAGIDAAFQAVSLVDNAVINEVVYNVELSKNLLKLFNELHNPELGRFANIASKLNSRTQEAPRAQNNYQNMQIPQQMGMGLSQPTSFQPFLAAQVPGQFDPQFQNPFGQSHQQVPSAGYLGTQPMRGQQQQFPRSRVNPLNMQAGFMQPQTFIPQPQMLGGYGGNEMMGNLYGNTNRNVAPMQQNWVKKSESADNAMVGMSRRFGGAPFPRRIMSEDNNPYFDASQFQIAATLTHAPEDSQQWGMTRASIDSIGVTTNSSPPTSFYPSTAHSRSFELQEPGGTPTNPNRARQALNSSSFDCVDQGYSYPTKQNKQFPVSGSLSSFSASSAYNEEPSLTAEQLAIHSTLYPPQSNQKTNTPIASELVDPPLAPSLTGEEIAWDRLRQTKAANAALRQKAGGGDTSFETLQDSSSAILDRSMSSSSIQRKSDIWANNTSLNGNSSSGSFDLSEERQSDRAIPVEPMRGLTLKSRSYDLGVEQRALGGTFFEGSRTIGKKPNDNSLNSFNLNENEGGNSFPFETAFQRMGLLDINENNEKTLDPFLTNTGKSLSEGWPLKGGEGDSRPSLLTSKSCDADFFGDRVSSLNYGATLDFNMGLKNTSTIQKQVGKLKKDEEN